MTKASKVKAPVVELKRKEAAAPFTVRLRPADAATLERIARKHGMGPRALARRIIEAYLEQHGGEK